MIALDTNILVYAHRRDSPWHDKAREVVKALAEGSQPWAIAWTCLHEFYGIVTHSRICAVCELHGISELWTADRDLSRFKTLRTKNPLV